MKQQFNPKHFVVHGRFTIWRGNYLKPVETVQELAIRIGQDAAKT